MESRDVVLKQRPVGLPARDDFEIVTRPVPEPGAGEVKIRNVCMSVDPYMRGRVVDRKSYTPPFQVGEVLTGGAIGRVIASKAEGLSEGDYVQHNYGWREAKETVFDGIDRAPGAFIGLFTGANTGKMIVNLEG